jgi:hypothetical protein
MIFSPPPPGKRAEGVCLKRLRAIDQAPLLQKLTNDSEQRPGLLLPYGAYRHAFLLPCPLHLLRS